MSKDCLKKIGSTEYGRPASMQVPRRSAAPEEPTGDMIEDVVNKWVHCWQPQK